MSKPIDQEREAFEAAFPVPQGIAWSGKEYVTKGRQEVNMFVHLCRVAAAYDKMHAVWQARAAVPPAGVTDGWVAVTERMPEKGMPVQVWCDGSDQAGVAWRNGDVWWMPEPQAIGYESITHWQPLAAAPHPVSGERAPIDITGRIPAPYIVSICPLCGDDILADAPVTLVKALERQGLAHAACVKGEEHET